MFINVEVVLPTPESLHLCGRSLRAILVVPAASSSEPPPSNAEAVAVAPGAQAENWTIAAEMLTRFRQTDGETALLVTADSALDADSLDARLSVIIPARPDGLLVTGVRAGADLQRIDIALSVAEVMAGREPGTTALVAIMGDNPSGLLAAGSFAGKSTRLRGIGWRAAMLADQMGIDTGQRAQIQTDAISLGRGLTALAATTAGVTALDWLDPNLLATPLSRACADARANGFGALITGNPDHLQDIAAAFR
ncbi:MULTISPECIES: hypothetical protein [Alphaproteobacteria]|uniref:HpcH/HpaI aldolase/citrate lyase domain-containing protein n=2 Tax=Alphaproteobacteria TaxID=28211 RepID=A0A512HCR1_9HYPH|nr:MULTISPECIES: hypothetical protein [Alphaproteobacteria]GEO83235.1 hypothetical protein RNA01_01670 [Ciceribacter naphthalenivorans]GLR20370.1 hypothetical protein GCM10007920_01540 [Ciceribacter naphthalenivorans]GLT03226.1 hypothetical protein GCM10007926_01540 [Sphingomonas psychrolutea]